MFTKLIQKTVDLDEGGKIDRISRYRRILLGFNFSRIQSSFFLVFRNCRDLQNPHRLICFGVVIFCKQVISLVKCLSFVKPKNVDKFIIDLFARRFALRRPFPKSGCKEIRQYFKYLKRIKSISKCSFLHDQQQKQDVDHVHET